MKNPTLEPTYIDELRRAIEKALPQYRDIQPFADFNKCHEILMRHVCDGEPISSIEKDLKIPRGTGLSKMRHYLRMLRNPNRTVYLVDFYEGRDDSILKTYVTERLKEKAK